MVHLAGEMGGQATPGAAGRAWGIVMAGSVFSGGVGRGLEKEREASHGKSVQ